jgi:dihydroorotase
MPAVDLAVTGGRIYHGGDFRQLTLGVTDGQVTHILNSNANLDATETVELEGEFVLPGLVDGHVHFREPGYAEKEGIESGTAAAAAGGVTTVVEMPNTTPPVLDVDRWTEKAELFERKSHVDFALFGAITDENIGSDDIAALADAGVTAFKTFMATSFGPLLMADKGELYAAFEEVARTDRPIYIHAEDEEYLDEFGTRAADCEGMDAFFESRPPIAETTAVSDVLDIVHETGAETVIAHTTTAEALRRIRTARLNGLPVHAEVTPYHLKFSRPEIERIGTRGIGTPPVRDVDNRTKLWARLDDGDVDLLGSDHAPHLLSEKNRPPLEVAPGMPQLETALGSLLDAVSAGRISLSRIVELYAEVPARIHDLYPRKGTLQVGSDADFVVVDTEREWTVNASVFESAGEYSPFNDQTLTGMPMLTYQRGQLVAEEMRTINNPGDGELYTPRAHSDSR